MTESSRPDQVPDQVPGQAPDQVIDLSQTSGEPGEAGDVSGEALPRRADYLGPAVRRPMILDAACSLFADSGFGATSMSQIAKAAGITKPVLYSCFPEGKREIILTVLEREEERVLDHLQGVLAITRRLPVADGIRLGISAFLEYAEVHPAGFRLLIASPSTSDPAVHEAAERVTEALVALMGERAKEMAEALGAPPAVGETFTRTIVAVADMLAKWWARDRPMEREQLVDLASALIMRGLEGLVPTDVLSRGVRSSTEQQHQQPNA